MINNLLNKKRYFLVLFSILFLYLIFIILFWKKLPDSIFVPLRFDTLRPVGFYSKTLNNVAYVFITPILAIMISQVASAIVQNSQTDLSTSLIISKLVDTLGYLLAILSPLSFFICSFYHTSTISYYFSLLGIMILIVHYLILKLKRPKKR